jgi:CRISPR system Cascade subunit CasB
MDQKSRKTLLRWWQGMNLPPAELIGKHIPPAPTSHRAQLRRCESVDGAMFTEGFRALWLKLGDEITAGDYVDQKMETWATISALLVHVRKDTKQKFAFQAGRKTDGDKSVVSELRFSQLQNSKTPDEFLRRMRRILKQINGEVSVEELGNDIEQWFFEHNQFRPRKAEKRISVRWAMDYYRAATLKK